MCMSARDLGDAHATEAAEREIAMQDPDKAELYRQLKEAYPDVPIHIK